MKLDENLNIFFKKYSIIALFAKYVDLWKDICFLITIWVNFFIITSYKDSNGKSLSTFYNSFSRMNHPVFFGGVINA